MNFRCTFKNVWAQAYEAAVARQFELHRDLNKLLEHKAGWTDEDVNRL
jgi:hypothetical protein